MASLYKQKRSPFWWMKCRDVDPSSPTFGKVIRLSTRMKIGVGADTRRAREMRADASQAESKMQGISASEHWGDWVPDFLKAHCKSPITLVRYKTVWRNLKMFLDWKQILAPRQLTRANCMEYLAWRLNPNKSEGKYRAVHNTAQMELKILSLIMREAVQRHFAPFNTALDLGIKRHQRTREKPEFTDDHIAFINQKIAQEPDGPLKDFLAVSSAIARYQGCRLTETHLDPRNDVDLNPPLIRFRIKGGRDHTAPLHPALVPLFEQLRKAKARETYALPRNPSRKWFDFLKRIGMRKILPGACFHCFRVTAVTRLARAGVVESKAMKFIGHASSTVHRTYQRLRTDDLQDCLAALASPDTSHAGETPDCPSTSAECQKGTDAGNASTPSPS